MTFTKEETELIKNAITMQIADLKGSMALFPFEKDEMFKELTQYQKLLKKLNLNIEGLSDVRLDQMLKSYDGDMYAVLDVIDTWGVDVCNKGYDIFDFDGTGMLEIEAINDVDAFEDDDDAVEAAMADGIKVIPVDELPTNFDRRYLGWIDTPENRIRIEEYCEGNHHYCNNNSLGR